MKAGKLANENDITKIYGNAHVGGQVGMWDKTEPVEIDVVKGRNVLRFSRPDATAGVTIREFTLTPVGSPARP